jgi:hypothetical protein
MAWLDRFPSNPDRYPFYPRLSVDQDDRLRIRAENIETAVSFLQDTQNKTSKGAGPTGFAPGYQIRIQHKVNMENMNRAIAKTAFNLAVHWLGTSVMSQPGFDACRLYCWTGEDNNPANPFVGYIVEDRDIARLPPLLSKRDEKRHVLMLASNGQRLVGLIRLYGGPVYRVHLGSADTPAFERYAVVDYGGAGIIEIQTPPTSQGSSSP